MNRIVKYVIIGIAAALCCIVLGLHLWIGHSVREHIDYAKERYPGSAEDALIMMLTDESNSYYDRTHKAIWTLGQIRSEKALPILNDLYKDDPEGETCFGKHDSMLCQFEIHKAIVSIEKNWLFSHQRLKNK